MYNWWIELIIREKNSSKSGDKRTRIFTGIRHTSESINCVAGIYLQGEKAETVTGGYSINYLRRVYRFGNCSGCVYLELNSTRTTRAAYIVVIRITH